MSDRSEDLSDTSPGDPRWSRVKRIFDEALQQPAVERDEFLDLACAGDRDLHAEVLQLLEDFEEAGEFLNYPKPEPAVERTFQTGAILLNRFRVLAFLGSGGMGQVYRAEDMLSGGSVALKAIRPEIAADARNGRRLKRELRLSRQVSHPNVCRVYELWSTPVPNGNDVVFLTMELLEGETLANRLAKSGKLQPKAALAIAKQIAAGIAEVHRIGIIHRDVKPSNVYLVPGIDGADRAIVMDFGLARSAVTGTVADLTQTGALLGTPAYMAPELFTGKEASVASDVYGFGVTLYEMLTGRNRMIVAPRKLVAGLDDGWERAIIRCLEPDPGKRPVNIGAVVDLIERGPRRARLKKTLAASVVLSTILLIGFFLAKGNGKASSPARVTRLTFDRGIVEELSFSADGKTLVYSSDQDTPAGNFSIWIQDQITGDRRQLVRSQWHDFEPAISPDGKTVAFRSERDGSGIYTVPSAGGTPKFLTPFGQNPRFSPDGKMLAYWTGQPGDVSEANARAWLIPVAGGEPQPLAANFADVRFPVWSPQGRKVMFWGASTGNPNVAKDTDWYVEDIASKVITRTHAFDRLHRLGLDPQSAPVFWGSDSIVFSARSSYSNNIWQMSYSESSPSDTGEPQRRTTGSGFEVVPWALPGGRIAYASWSAANKIWRVSTRALNREPEPITEEDARDARPTVSNDGRFLLFNRRMSDVQTVYLNDLLNGSEQTISKVSRFSPAISPNGLNAAYVERTAAATNIWVKDIAAGTETEVCASCGDILSWLPDNTGLLYSRNLSSSQREVSMIDLRTRMVNTVLAGDRFSSAAVSPEGRRIAFTVAVSGVRSDIFTAPFVRGQQSKLSDRVLFTGGKGWDEKPQWSSDGREIFFSSNRDGFVCLWRQSLAAGGHAIGQPATLVHMHKATMSPMHLSHVPTYNLSAAAKYLYFNAASISGNVWMLEP